MVQKLIVSGLIVFLVIGVSAQTDNGKETLENISLDKIKEEVNENQDEIPEFIDNIVGDQRINVDFTSTGMNFSAEMDGTRIEEINDRKIENPSLKVEVNDSAMNAVIESNNTVEEIKDQLDEGGITYKAMTIGNKVKIFIGDKLLGIGSSLGLL